MPSKNGFGNSRTPLNKKAQYGVDQKNPIMNKEGGGWLTDPFGIKERRRRRWAKEDRAEALDLQRQKQLTSGGGGGGGGRGVGNAPR
jgi:hypothetical protein